MKRFTLLLLLLITPLVFSACQKNEPEATSEVPMMEKSEEMNAMEEPMNDPSSVTSERSTDTSMNLENDMISEAVPLLAPETGETAPSSMPKTEEEIPIVSEPTASEPVTEPTPAPVQSAVKSFSINTTNWAFSPPSLSVNKGDTVRLTITNSSESEHGFALPQFGVNKDIAAGQAAVVEFVADKEGSFSFFCNVPCGPGHKEMKGTLMVQ